jgi:hypothetical protein
VPWESKAHAGIPLGAWMYYYSPINSTVKELHFNEHLKNKKKSKKILRKTKKNLLSYCTDF